MNSRLALVQACLAVSATLMAADPATQTAQALPPPVTDQRVAELKQLRFGLFVCWSFSTFSGKEWTPGITNLDLFHPSGCDVEQWVQAAKAAEMGYILFLTKHHDGFCLWDTNVLIADQRCAPEAAPDPAR